MKIKHLLWAVAPMALALSACQSDEPNDKGGNSSFTGDGYMAVNITLPTGTSTRAANDKFEEGTPNEYKINDAAIVLFKGNPADAESTYQIQGAYKILNPTESAGDETVTLQLSKTFKVNDVTLADNEKIFALALVNYTDVLEIDGTTLKVKGGAAVGTTFADLLKAESDNNFLGASTDKFFMTNAVMSNIAGGATAPIASGKSDIFTLVQCADKCIFEDAGTAALNPACTINVERATAKATLKCDNPTISINNGDGTSTEVKLTVAEVKWVLDNTQTSSFIIRNMGTGVDTYMGYVSEFAPDQYRMAGALMNNKLQKKARTYWCVDPVYDTDASAASFTTNTDVNGAIGTDHPQYCHENTFDVAHQTWKNTTRAVLKVTYAVGGEVKDLYVTNGLNTVFYADADKTGLKSAFVNDKALQDAYKQTIDGTVDMGEAFQFTYRTENGVQKVNTIKMGAQNLYTWSEAGATATPIMHDGNYLFTAEQVLALVAKAEADNVVTVYTGGVVYYQVRIKHFGDDLTPWDADGSVTATDNIEHTYGTTNAEKNFLGRYGMVRNNWYEINIGGFKRMGDNKFPTVENNDTPDDQKDDDKFMSVDINVLSWAKRSQTETL